MPKKTPYQKMRSMMDKLEYELKKKELAEKEKKREKKKKKGDDDK